MFVLPAPELAERTEARSVQWQSFFIKVQTKQSIEAYVEKEKKKVSHI